MEEPEKEQKNIELHQPEDMILLGKEKTAERKEILDVEIAIND